MSDEEKKRYRSSWDEKADRWEERANRWEERWEFGMQQRSKHGHVWTGIFILLIGVAALIKVSVPEAPRWIFSWQMFLVGLGFFIGFKHGFRGISWVILIIVGGLFLFKEIYPAIAFGRYIWPVALIVVGGFLILGPRRKHSWQACMDEKKKQRDNSGIEDATVVDESFDSKEDFVDITSVFGGTKKNIISKNFKGGDLVNIFGGTELNLTRSDFKGTVELELTNIFGGTTLIIPADWSVRSDAVTVFGGLEDKRNVQHVTGVPDKLIVLRGTIFFGGVQIKSY